jgi:hypothetical protein
VREAAREQAAQWAVVHPQGTVAAAQTGVDASAVLRAGARTTVVPPTAAASQTGADTLVAGLMEIAHVHAPDGGGWVDGDRGLYRRRGSPSPDRYHDHHAI